MQNDHQPKENAMPHREEDDAFLHRPALPYFCFTEIAPVAKLSCERLTPDNFEQLYLLFRNDSSPFVDSRLKTLEGVKAYASDL